MAKYTVDEAKERISRNPSEARREYTRLRDIAQKRIQRMKGTEFERSKAYREHKQGFMKLKDIDPRDLDKALSEVSKFVEAKGSSVTGQRQKQTKTIKTINEAIGARKGEGVTRQNYWGVIDILERARKLKIVYGSDKIVELARATMQLTQDQFEDALDHLETLLQHSDEVERKLSDYTVIHQGESVEIDEFLDEVGW